MELLGAATFLLLISGLVIVFFFGITWSASLPSNSEEKSERDGLFFKNCESFLPNEPGFFERRRARKAQEKEEARQHELKVLEILASLPPPTLEEQLEAQRREIESLGLLALLGTFIILDSRR